MDHSLSPQTEEFLANMVANGVFPSRAAAIEAAVSALREKAAAIPAVPAEHLARVEQAIESANAGLTTPMTADDWAGLRQRARDVAARGGSQQ